jgi:hypothetical protein
MPLKYTRTVELGWPFFNRSVHKARLRPKTSSVRVPKLSDLEEQTIVQFILDLDSRGFPPRLRCVEEMANRLLADRDAPPLGK